MNDLTSLQAALKSLEDALAQPFDEYVRDAAIKRFELTFELAWKAMKRTLKEEGIDVSSPKQVFRAAGEAKIIDDVEGWFALLKERNLTVHTYNEATAQEVFESAKSFPPIAKKLLQTLKKR